METISKQIAYLRAIMDGMEFDSSSKEGRIFESILAVLDEINESIDYLFEYQDEMAEQVNMIDEDLAEVESELADECDDCCCCDDDDDLEYYEIECPKCGETICLDEDFFNSDDDIVCPNCGENIDIEFDDDDTDEE